MVQPSCGDYVGRRTYDGVELYVCAVNTRERLVRIGELDCANMSGWLNEAQARAEYSYWWGKRTPIPWMTMAAAERMNNPPPYQTPSPDYGLHEPSEE